jgi:hypothetical protein
MADVLEFDLSQLVVAGRVGVDLVLVAFVRSAECEESEGAEDGHGEDETDGVQGGCQRVDVGHGMLRIVVSV